HKQLRFARSVFPHNRSSTAERRRAEARRSAEAKKNAKLRRRQYSWFHHGTRGKMPRTTRATKAVAIATAQLSSVIRCRRRRGSCEKPVIETTPLQSTGASK